MYKVVQNHMTQLYKEFKSLSKLDLLLSLVTVSCSKGFSAGNARNNSSTM